LLLPNVDNECTLCEKEPGDTRVIPGYDPDKDLQLMNDRICPSCGGPIVGRKDKKYCSDTCRYFIKNQNRTEAGLFIDKTNQTLRKNRNILQTLCPEGKATVRKSVLDKRGYDFSVFSSLFVTQNRQVYYLCYDYGCMALSDNGVKRVLIISRQPYMPDWDPWKHLPKTTQPAGPL